MSFAQDARIVSRELGRYYRESVRGARPVIRQPPIEELVDGLELRKLATEGGMRGKKLTRFLRRYLRLHHAASSPGGTLPTRWPSRTPRVPWRP